MSIVFQPKGSLSFTVLCVGADGSRLEALGPDLLDERGCAASARGQASDAAVVCALAHTLFLLVSRKCHAVQKQAVV